LEFRVLDADPRRIRRVRVRRPPPPRSEPATAEAAD
jgi:CBS domain containing-hemolysin-like protein